MLDSAYILTHGPTDEMLKIEGGGCLSTRNCSDYRISLRIVHADPLFLALS